MAEIGVLSLPLLPQEYHEPRSQTPLHRRFCPFRVGICSLPAVRAHLPLEIPLVFPLSPLKYDYMQMFLLSKLTASCEFTLTMAQKLHRMLHVRPRESLRGKSSSERTSEKL